MSAGVLISPRRCYYPEGGGHPRKNLKKIEKEHSAEDEPYI